MNIDIRTQGFPLTRKIKALIRRRFETALPGDNRRIRRVEVTLSDINGPRGGIDKRCQFNVTLAGTSNVVVKETSGDMYSAITRAAQRTGRNLMKRINKLETHKPTARGLKSSTRHDYALVV